MNYKNLIFKSIGVISFLSVVACEDNITNDIENIEESVLCESDNSTILQKESIAEIEARADEVINRFRKTRKSVFDVSDQPVWVGVLVSKGTCPNSTMEIIYHMDCEDDKDNDSRNGTRYGDEGCYKSAGLTWDKKRNADWRVCVVDARKYKFGRMKYAYAIFDLSFEKFWNGAYEVYIHSDDEDKKNDNHYKPNTYLGFAANTNYPYIPKQEGSFNRKTGWTEMWFYYFPADPKSTLKLPNLGFEYDVFSNFNCCNNEKQNLFYVDSEDNRKSNDLKIYKNSYDKGTTIKDGFIDNQFKVIGNTMSHLIFAIQSSSKYRER